MSRSDELRLIHEPIDPNAVFAAVQTPAAGAVVLFLGTVRELTRGRRTLALDYDAYPAMVEVQLKQLAREARNRWPIEQLAIVHRLGHLQPGEISVAVAVSTPHRRDAFEAGQHLIDRLKEVVPIWKRENWDDGTREWVHHGTS